MNPKNFQGYRISTKREKRKIRTKNNVKDIDDGNEIMEKYQAFI